MAQLNVRSACQGMGTLLGSVFNAPTRVRAVLMPIITWIFSPFLIISKISPPSTKLTKPTKPTAPMIVAMAQQILLTVTAVTPAMEQILPVVFM